VQKNNKQEFTLHEDNFFKGGIHNHFPDKWEKHLISFLKRPILFLYPDE
jgi:hypothetical protein